MIGLNAEFEYPNHVRIWKRHFKRTFWKYMWVHVRSTVFESSFSLRICAKLFSLCTLISLMVKKTSSTENVIWLYWFLIVATISTTSKSKKISTSLRKHFLLLWSYFVKVFWPEIALMSVNDVSFFLLYRAQSACFTFFIRFTKNISKKPLCRL